MSTTARFHINRKKILSKVFAKNAVVEFWKKEVRYQMRNLDIKDLHDYYDFNIYIEDKVDSIRNEIINGKYSPSKPLIYKLEKKYGISRHMMIPSPSDALVFQTISNEIGKLLKTSSPSAKAFFSRDKSYLKLPHQYSKDSDEIWPILWKKFQENIFQFSKAYKYLVVTDIATYFDNIGLRELRHVISSRIKTDEAVLDLLFVLVETLSWKPDYLPNSLKGLPTINIESPRLLAHIFLFEVDDILKKETNNSFVRWMDDINFGVDTEQKACMILSDINDVLKSRGLALNLAKTKIYSAEEAENHFLFKENKYLDTFQKKLLSGKYTKGQLSYELEQKYLKHCKNRELRNWDKVTKRFFTMEGKIKSQRFLKYSYDLFKARPGLRSNILYYFLSLGYRLETFQMIIKIIKEIDRYDDVTLFAICQLLTDWTIPVNKISTRHLQKIETELLKFTTPFEFYCYLWFAAKYSHPKNILSTILTNRKIWNNDPFLSRQITSIIPRLFPVLKNESIELLSDQIKKGISDVTSVAVNISFLLKIKKYPPGLEMYLFPTKPQIRYPLEKYLILITIMNSTPFGKDKSFIKKVKKHIKDPYYQHWLSMYFSI